MWKLLLICLLLIETAYQSEVSYYEILGVTKQASAQEIRQAYKKLAIKFHPDKNPGQTQFQEEFLKITEAYETLKDPDKRHKYDVYGSYPTYSKKYDYRNQAEYDNLYYNGLYHDDPFVDTLNGNSFSNYLQDGFHFINFYSPFCPPCRNLVDHWKKLAEVYKGIVKVGAVNCKYHNSFCYNSMRIGSYPTLIFYPNGKNGNFIYYRGDRIFDDLSQFIMKYLKAHLHIPTVIHILKTDKPIAYVLGSNRIDNDALTRIGYHLKGLVHLVRVEDDSLRAKLSEDEYTTIVFSHPRSLPKNKEIHSTDEKEILKEIVEAMPKVESIEPEKLKKIRNELRQKFGTPWVLYFSTKKGEDRLTLYKITSNIPDMNFGEIDCDKWEQLCISLQVDETPAWAVLKPGGAYQRVHSPNHIRLAAEAVRLHSLSAREIDCDKWEQLCISLQVDQTPAWAVLKPGGAYQRLHSPNHIRLAAEAVRLHSLFASEIDCDKWEQLCISLQVDQTPAWAVLKPGGAYQRVHSPNHIRLAAEAVRLHSLSASEFTRIVDGEMGSWVLAVVPYKLSWDHIVDPFTKASIHFNNVDDKISFGIMTCTSSTDNMCRRLAPNQPSIVIQQGRTRTYFNGRINERDLVEFIDLLRDSKDMELNEQQILEVMDASSREHSWLVAFLPANCGRLCDELMHEWRIVAKKLRPLEFIRVGAMQCGRQTGGFCSNVRSPTARLYPLASGHHYTVSLQNLQQAPYMLEWALGYIDDSVTKLNWNSFNKLVIAEDLRPNNNKKPWLVYFHSPRCYRCYEMYADFAIAGILLNNAVQLGKVNCVNERGLCQHEQITSYPSLKLYLGRNKHHSFSSVISIPVRDYTSLLKEITPHLKRYDDNLLSGINVDIRQGVHMKHDEF